MHKKIYNKHKIIVINVIKIILLLMVINILITKFDLGEEQFKAVEFTKSGINSIYTIKQEYSGIKYEINPEKILYLTGMIVIMYLNSQRIGINLLNGLKKVIRNKSENYNQYIFRIIRFYLKYVLLDVFIFIISTICVIQYHRQFNTINLANVILNLSLMSIFYIMFPLVLIILLEKAEFFIGGMIVGTALSTLFLHQLPYNISVFVILITVVITYYISVWKERFN